jgi:hypothetical protein
MSSTPCYARERAGFFEHGKKDAIDDFLGAAIDPEFRTALTIALATADDASPGVIPFLNRAERRLWLGIQLEVQGDGRPRASG